VGPHLTSLAPANGQPYEDLLIEMADPQKGEDSNSSEMEPLALRLTNVNQLSFLADNRLEMPLQGAKDFAFIFARSFRAETPDSSAL